MSEWSQRELSGGMTVAATPEQAGAAAADVAAAVIAKAIAERGSARVILASAPSQEDMLAALGRDPRIDWTKVRSFHMDEYLGLAPDHPQAFGQWLVDRLPADALPGFERIVSTNDPRAEAERYATLLQQAPIDLTCLGFGVNGHIAFNEPDDARFDDDVLVRQVELTPTSRVQQVDDAQFPSLDDVPTHALTLTVPALVSSAAMVATVLGERKAPALAMALTDPVSPRCPATILRTHPNASLHVDVAAASMLPGAAAPERP
ncbi:6-phosphogluconolactonase [Haloactinopolyspora sp.]|uniref:6-phosphogluconolactonase n=1 Tax=Haloactinopolyspora sp. TaxID=1966353 RepID=UPI0026184392|nr:6-phosphogluconolactonase [Haloactinopolyspora sp.]